MPKKNKPPKIPASNRVQHAANLLYEGVRPTAVAKAVARKFGINERTAWNDIAQARKDIERAFEGELPTIRAQLWDYYTRMMEMAEAAGDVRGGVSAAQALAKLTGADSPSKSEVEHKGGVLVVSQQDSESDWEDEAVDVDPKDPV